MFFAFAIGWLPFFVPFPFLLPKLSNKPEVRLNRHDIASLDPGMTDRKDRITKNKREAQPSRELKLMELGDKLKRLAGFRAKVKTEFKKEQTCGKGRVE